jgi:hypothetical protein
MKLLVPLLCLLAISMTASANDWTPPANPDVRAIRKEADQDERAGRYDVALAKRAWFHENVNKYRPSMSGVRLSFALSEWMDLAAVYPPALTKLKEVRDETKTRILANVSDKGSFDDLSSLAAINEKLGEEADTVATFKLVEKQNPKMARSFYFAAEDSLIKEKEYELCNKYIRPDRSVTNDITLFGLESPKLDPRFANVAKDSRNRRFIENAATLIALLVINDRQEEAEQAVAKYKTVEADAEFHKQLATALDKALAGKLPD